MKRIIPLLLAVVMVGYLFAGCQKDNAETTTGAPAVHPTTNVTVIYE